MDELYHLRDNGLFLRREAIEAGYDDLVLRRGLQQGWLKRVRHGVYLAADRWQGLDKRGRHLMRAEAVIATHGDRVVLSHQTAALIHGIDLFQPDLATVHAHVLGTGSSRVESGITYHQAPPPDGVLVQWRGGLVCPPDLATMEVAANSDLEAAVVVLDAALRAGIEMGQLAERFEEFNYRKGHRMLQIAMRLTRPGADSVGESRCRFFFWQYHLPEPELQVEIRDADGNLLGILDFLWRRHGVAGEFDGQVKYRQLLRPGEQPEDAVFREKQREDRIRAETGYFFFRIVTKDLYDAPRTAARLRDVLERGQQLQRRTA
ncbi:MAG TPA: type IV toxin-antitoxin system AbiEi family antitoxin domain-containing protein [Marmoricola sp.]|nr:type IV toxin-antitoxin system AbiEi family antitoxin domain-containing protein [Marmoricola sp.]